MRTEMLEELFDRTLSDDYQSDAAWNAVNELQRLASQAVFDQAAAWCRSQNSMKRARGADILGQIGKTAEHPSNCFPDESFTVVSDMLARETETLPLASAIFALGHIDDPRAISLLVQFQSHPNAKVRFAAAFSLACFADDPIAAKVLTKLTSDADADVRDWATFGLGVLGQLDTPEIRDAIAARLNDDCSDAREEALIGLAKRRDQRVLVPLLSSLESIHVPDRAIEAAYEMLGLDNKDGEGWTATDFAAALRTNFGL